MGIRKNKKAILFSLISVLFSILFITIFSQRFITTQEDRIPGINVRIRVIDVYTRNFEDYVSDSIKLATYKALDALTLYQESKGTFFADSGEFNRTFYNCMLCGYVNCSLKNTTNNCSIEPYDLTSKLDNITELSRQQLNIYTEYSVNSVEISQLYPFEVEIKANVSFNITDATAGKKYASWSKEVIILQPVEITGLLEPYGKISDATYDRRIKKYSGPCEFNQSCWNNFTTTSFYRNQSFRYHGNSTSFLQRYWDDNNESFCCGIETILHPGEIAPLEPRNSYIDQYYWEAENSCDSGSMVLAVNLGGDEVHLDEITATRYGVYELSRPYCTP